MARAKPKEKILIREYPNDMGITGEWNREYEQGEVTIERCFDDMDDDEFSELDRALKTALRGEVFVSKYYKLLPDERSTVCNVAHTTMTERFQTSHPISNSAQFKETAETLFWEKEKLYKMFKLRIPRFNPMTYQELFETRIEDAFVDIFENERLSLINYWLCHFSIDALFYQTEKRFIAEKKRRASTIKTAISTLMDENVFGESKWISHTFWETLFHHFDCELIRIGENTKYSPVAQNFIELRRLTGEDLPLTETILADIMYYTLILPDVREHIFPEFFKDGKPIDSMGVKISNKFKDQIRKIHLDELRTGWDIVNRP
jgi:hypothetical protein